MSREPIFLHPRFKIARAARYRTDLYEKAIDRFAWRAQIALAEPAAHITAPEEAFGFKSGKSQVGRIPVSRTRSFLLDSSQSMAIYFVLVYGFLLRNHAIWKFWEASQMKRNLISRKWHWFQSKEGIDETGQKEWPSVKHALGVLCVLIMLFGFGTIPLWAQLTVGGVSGTVKDPTGAVVRGARITLTNEATKVSQRTVSTETGTYVFASVPIGTYTLQADAPGFKTYVDTGIEVHIQSTVTADIPLVPGGVKQEVIVTSAVPLLQAQDASLGQTVPTEQINDLPLNGRNWTSLVQLSAGTYSSGLINGSDPGQEDFRLNGTDDNNEVFGGTNVVPVPDAMQEFKLQDGDNNAQFGQFAGAVVNAETKSGTNHLNGDLWEYWRNEALNANSYFNNLHNTPRQEYRQNQYGGTIGGPVYIPHVYNGKNRTFFFFDYQHTGITQQSAYTETVPTDLMQSSGFTNLQDLITGNSGSNTDALGRKFSHGTVLDPATTRSVAPGAVDPVSGFTNTTTSTVYVRDPFYTGGSIAGIKDFTGLTSRLNIIPQGRLDPNAVKLLSLFPAQTTSGLSNNYYTTPPSPTSTDQYDLRIDENFSQKNLLWGVFNHWKTNTGAVQPFPGAIGEALGAQINSNPHYEISLHYTHVFSPEMENEMTGGYAHLITHLEQPEANTLGIPAQYGIQGIPQFAGNGGLPDFVVNGISQFGGHGYRPSLNADTGLQFQDNLMKLHRNHEFNVGFDFNHVRGDILQPGSSKGHFTFSGQYTDIPNKNSSLTGIADLLLTPIAATVPNGINYLGSMSNYYGSNYAKTYYYGNYLAAYAQDNWRVTSRLTLNLGVRWDYFSPYNDSNGREANFIQTGGTGSSGIYYIPKKGCEIPRSDSFNAVLAADNIQVDCVSGLSVNKTQKNNFAPRVGFAYRLPGHGLVLRGGYGISYGAFDSVGYGNTLGTNYPFQYTIGSLSTTSQIPELLPDGVTTATIENTFGAVSLQDPTLVTGQNSYLFGKQYNYLTPMTQSANLTFQYQFTNRDSIQWGYVGSLGRHLDTFGSQNAPTKILPVSVNSQNYVPFQNLARGPQFLESKAVSNYHSLQVNYQHQFKNNLVILANYTYGKCMSDDNGKTGLGGGYRAEWLPGFGIGPDYQLCSGDAKHVIHASGEYALPFGRGNLFLSGVNRLTDAFIGGWQLNFIYTYQSGAPLNLGCATATTSDYGCNANLVQGQDPYAGPHNQTQWLNPDAFATPPDATAIGQADFSPLGGKADQVRGPGYSDLDASMFKNFATGDGTSLQFRAEFFNVLNAVEFGTPGQLNYTNHTNFSAITGTQGVGARIGQLALKFFF